MLIYIYTYDFTYRQTHGSGTREGERKGLGEKRRERGETEYQGETWGGNSACGTFLTKRNDPTSTCTKH
ncbi:hypothetical protein M407DRAFT_241028, partial [Tulasnella calospora MUT 4182]